MASIVVSGDVLRRPRGGNLATHLHYLIGLRKLGHQVVYLEDRGVGGQPADSSPGGVPRAGIVLLADLLRRCRVDVPVVWVDPDAGLVGGMVWPQLRRRLSKADLLIDLGGHSWLEERTLPRRRALIDVDSTAPSSTLGSAPHQLEHDVYFSYRHDPAALPDAEWLATIPPVVPRLWYGPPSRPELPLRVCARAAGTSSQSGEPAACGIPTEQLLALPGLISPRPWMALPAADQALGEELRGAGFSVRDGETVDASLSSFRGNMIGSQALLNLGGGNRSWFTGLDACFLAAARPVIACDPDIDAWLPTGTGLIAVADLDEAVSAVERVQGELARHAAAARRVAESVFHFRVVLPSLLEQALPRRLQAVA
jgi:hypothetical protein